MANSDADNCNAVVSFISDNQVEVLFDYVGIAASGDTVDGLISYEGFAAFKVNVRDDLPANTIIVNQAWLRVFNEADSSCLPAEITNEYFHTVYECGFVIPNDTIICSNESVEIDAEQSYVDSYIWQLDGVEYVNPQFEFAPNSFGEFDLTLITSNSLCSDTSIVQVEIKENPQILALTPDENLCSGDSIQLLAQSVNSADSIVWEVGVENGQYIFPDISENDYRVTITNPAGCSISDTVHLNVFDLPQSIQISGDTFYVENNGPFDYIWLLNGTETSILTSEYINSNLNGDTIEVRVSLDNGCDTTLMLITSSVGLNDWSSESKIVIYPNPIGLNSVLFMPEGLYTIDFFDLAGRLIISRQVQGNSMELGSLNLSLGLYHMKISSKGKSVSIKVLVNL